MTNVTRIYGDRSPKWEAAPRRRAAKASAADIDRALKVANAAGLTIYGFTVVGDQVHVQTRPAATGPVPTVTDADAWFASRG